MCVDLGTVGKHAVDVVDDAEVGRVQGVVTGAQHLRNRLKDLGPEIWEARRFLFVG